MAELQALTEENPLRNALCDAACQAAAVAITRGREGISAEAKADKSLVTLGDRDAQIAIMNRLKHYADSRQDDVKFRFLAEEKLDQHMRDNLPPGIEQLVDTPQEWEHKDKKGFYWIIDPIDGTGNYARIYDPNLKVPEAEQKPWAVSIALQHDGKTIASAVYEAAAGEMDAHIDASGKVSGLKGKLYWAERGITADAASSKGAYVIDCKTGNARKLSCDVKAPLDGSKGYIEHFVPDSDAAGQMPTQKVQGPLFQSQAAIFQQHGMQQADVRSACVAALHVAAGENEKGEKVGAFSHGFACPWDWAATALILQEAGVPVLVADAGTCRVKPDCPPLAIMLTARHEQTAKEMVEQYQSVCQEHYKHVPACTVLAEGNLNGFSDKKATMPLTFRAAAAGRT